MVRRRRQSCERDQEEGVEEVMSQANLVSMNDLRYWISSVSLPMVM